MTPKSRTRQRLSGPGVGRRPVVIVSECCSSVLARISAFDPAPTLAALRCPLLAIFGAGRRAGPGRVIGTVLAEARHPDHQIVIFPRSDHNVRVFTGPGELRGQYVPGERAAGFDELVVTWLQRRLVAAGQVRTNR